MQNAVDRDVVTLKDWALLHVCGSDAASFLHGQLTQDIVNLDAKSWRYAGYCNTKGRLYTTALVWRPEPDAVFLAVPASNADFLVKRLAMFVLRAKAKVEKAAPEMVAVGLMGTGAIAALQAHCAPLPDVGGVLQLDDTAGNGYALNCNTSQTPRIMFWLPAGHALMQAVAQYAVTDAAWHAADVQAAIAHVDAATREAFVPQMINFELVGGVNFKKGCYPGQEIVARSQYLGKLKRRMAIATVAGLEPVAPLADIFADGATEPIGSIATAAPDSDGLHWLIGFESTLAAQADGNLHLADGRALNLLALPYSIVDVTA